MEKLSGSELELPNPSVAHQGWHLTERGPYLKQWGIKVFASLLCDLFPTPWNWRSCWSINLSSKLICLKNISFPQQWQHGEEVVPSGTGTEQCLEHRKWDDISSAHRPIDHFVFPQVVLPTVWSLCAICPDLDFSICVIFSFLSLAQNLLYCSSPTRISSPSSWWRGTLSPSQALRIPHCGIRSCMCRKLQWDPPQEQN